MTPHVRRLLGLLCPLVLLAGCGPSGQQHTTQLLGDRLLAQMTPDIAAGNAVLQPLPDGARVTLLGPSRFPPPDKGLDDQQRDIRAGVVEGLLDPTLMRIEVADTSPLPPDERDARVRNVTSYLRAYGLGSTLQPVAPAPAMPSAQPGAPPGLTITIGIQCASSHDGLGYGSGRPRPVCD